MLEYKGYIGKVTFDDEADLIHGEVVGLRDVITFQGESVTELRQAFQESIDDYLEWCEKLGQKPEKPYSGQFVVRLSPEIHRAVAQMAQMEGKSLNGWVATLLQRVTHELKRL
jgi:predicted HicB family RNase H-like nuclease